MDTQNQDFSRIATRKIIKNAKFERDSISIDLDYVANHSDFTFGLCEFLDEFKRSDNKGGMIENSPQPGIASRESLCILAAVAHKLANDYSLDIPKWVFHPMYKMPHPIFAHNTTNEEYQRFLIGDSPREFADKNVFYGSRAIERV